MTVDVAKRGADQEIVSEAMATFGGIDALVNNWSFFHPTPLGMIPPKMFKRFIVRNLRPLVHLLMGQRVGTAGHQSGVSRGEPEARHRTWRTTAWTSMR
jgi:NAD(P)-dependent dehydrogenase (short-subunit alcohol dehydrogenase family)